MSSLCPLFLAAQKCPTRPVLTGSNPMTYEELHTYASQLSDQFSHYPPKTVWALYPDNSPFTLALLFACLRSQHVFFPISPRLPPEEVKRLLKKTQAAHFFTSSLPYRQKKINERKVHIEPDLPFTYLLTSGSTSDPKICVHSYHNHYYSALGSNEHLHYDENGSWLLSLPLFHIGGLSLIFRTLLARARLIVPNLSLDQTLNSNRPSHLSLVPTQLQRLIDHKALPHLSCVLLGGAPLSQTLIQKAQERHIALYPTYGLTEMSSQVVTYAPQEKKMTLLPYRELLIQPDSEILLKGKTLFLGYLENGEIVPKINSKGYYATRDLGSYKKKGFSFLGRKDHLFISGGENIQPEEIEQHLLTHPAIEEVIITPQPDDEFGARPFAWIRSTKPMTVEILSDYLKNKLPKFKHPIGCAPLVYSGLKPSRKKLKSNTP